MKSVPLSSLDAEIRTVEAPGGRSVPALWFRCPLCPDHPDHPDRSHWRIVPYRPEGGKIGGMLVWKHEAGETVEDLTLSPSYLAENASCRLHAFIRGGDLHVLDDSGAKWTG